MQLLCLFFSSVYDLRSLCSVHFVLSLYSLLSWIYLSLWNFIRRVLAGPFFDRDSVSVCASKSQGLSLFGTSPEFSGILKVLSSLGHKHTSPAHRKRCVMITSVSLGWDGKCAVDLYHSSPIHEELSMKHKRFHSLTT